MSGRSGLAKRVATAVPPIPVSTSTPKRVQAATIVLFWAAQFAILTAQRLLLTDDDASFLTPRLLVTGVGILLSFGIGQVHQWSSGRGIGERLAIAAVAALGGAILHAGANFLIFHLFMPERSVVQVTLATYAFGTLQWFWAYAALSALLLAAVYAAELTQRERRMAQLQREAHAAHLRALRYQLNPHFMFNTLNSIASLVSAREVETAEQMVENLSDFLRAGLAIDPNDDIPLSREIELQSLYLAIEQVRFPDRLAVAIDVPNALADAPVPSLIVQPLVENAVRHAVATSTTPVTIRIAATPEGGAMRLVVSDSGGNGGAGRVAGAGRGTGVGLANVRERLRARYGSDGGFTAGPQDGGFAVTFTVPLVRRLGE